MGGRALSKPSVRLAKSHYDRVSHDCVTKLRTLYPQLRIDVIASYASKADFGDCDILIENAESLDIEAAARALGALEVVRNGPVTSMGVEVTPGELFQVDLIGIERESFDFARGYLGFNDLGNLVGRVAHRLGLSLRHDALVYHAHDGSHRFATITLTKNYEDALDFLGFDVDRYRRGFDNRDEIFEFVASGTYFDPSIYLLENRNAKARERDAKRPTYTAFLRYCASLQERTQRAGQGRVGREDVLPLVAQRFPHFEPALAQAQKRLERARAFKQRFNGQWVAEQTGLQGVELGRLIQRFRESFASVEEFESSVLSSTDAQLGERLRRLAAEVLDRPSESGSVAKRGFGGVGP